MLKRINIFAVIAALLIAGNVCAKPKSVGAVFSAYYSVLNYQKYVQKEKSFLSIGLGAEYGSVLLGQTEYPGFYANMGYNFIIGSKQHDSGNSILYSGPSLTAGYFADKGKPHGFGMAFSGVLGYEYRFKLPVSLSVEIAPTLGMVLYKDNSHFILASYWDGLIYSLCPRIGIKYCF